MKFTTHDVKSTGSFQQGQLATDYDTLVETFGLPRIGPSTDPTDDNVTCMWAIQFSDGTIATVYDWKTTTTPYHLHCWIIGGYDSRAVDRVLAEIDLMKVDFAWHSKTDEPPATLVSIVSIIQTGITRLNTAETPMQTAEYLNTLGDILKYHAQKIELGQTSETF